MQSRKSTLFIISFLGLSLTLLLSSATAQTSGPVYSCVTNNNGAVRIVTTATVCTSKEHLVTWSVTGPQSPPGPTGATGPAGSQGPTGPQGPQGPAGAGAVVKDANDVIVGVYLGPGVYGGLTIHPVGNDFVALDVRRNHLFGIGTDYFLHYQNANCTGPVFIRDDFGNDVLIRGSLIVGGTIYYTTVSPTNVLLLSKGLQSDQHDCLVQGGTFTPPDRCCLQDQSNLSVAPAMQEDISIVTLPFHIELQQ
jgi:hypothetical protein